ncbi:NAD(P)H-dependent oxidoreductase [Bacillus safensis]|uniref:NAD(P)H-dependent oxidoreductase n=1 Tax=Bacillus safensis TaxID=561879 RepID=UPI001560A703|nr:NAD(P)H-dependent oxidoreductase [Bacillus safensis]MCR6473572.1 NAD(P)H-dependent oxidoreductase [Bacillus safensis]NRF05312.1 NAD(P)H-dependent oxidoreductase [Bacillus safensis]WBL30760.1 Glutathione-regulated potassium-efflux system ancillary protein KefG [Bacillus safensis]
MNHVIIFAHPQQSLNQTLLDLVVSTLLNNGHKVTVRDVYALGFSPELTLAEKAAIKCGDVPIAIQREQMLIQQADVLTFIFPIWWTGLPAMLKGYVERVFSEGFAYQISEDGEIENLLRHKKGVIINTHDAPRTFLESNKVFSSSHHMTTDTEVFNFIGVQPVERLLFSSMEQASADYIHEILKETKETVDQLFPPAV